jgi:hypothetical protein
MTGFADLSDKSMIRTQGAVEIRCPQDITSGGPHTVFIAGGIGGNGNVANWQQEMIFGHLSDVDVTALNPRRENFPVGDPNALQEQVRWEHRGLSIAQSISFWLPAGYSCPITIYELGVWSMRAKPIFVGIDPLYPNRDSLISQMAIARPNLAIVDNLTALSEQVRQWRAGSARLDVPQPRPAWNPKSVYLSGGISGCPDWQKTISDTLNGSNITIVDPRNRDVNAANLSSSDLRALATQNHTTLLGCEAFCVWFPEESTSPASLFELGALASMLERPLFVGAHPRYFRSRDVTIQTGLVRPEVRVVDSLDALAAQVSRYYSMR